MEEKMLLSEEEVVELAEALLSNEEGLREAPALTLCRNAAILYRYGFSREKGRPLLLALNFLMQAEETEPALFEESGAAWRHLWGNVLVHLSQIIHDYSFLEQALVQYKQASLLSSHQERLYWDWAQAWLLLGVHSSEPSDLKKGLGVFQRAAERGCESPFFRIDYAVAYLICGTHAGNPAYLEKASTMLQGVIADTYEGEAERAVAYEKAWIAYANVCRQLYTLTHLPDHFEQAEKVLREAILSVPSNSDLWVDWGELYLYAGWLNRDLSFIEAGIDKLTSSKIKEGDPLRVSAVLGRGLTLLGIFTEDLKLLKEGKERVHAALQIAPKHPELTFAAAVSEFAYALYFSDVKSFGKAISYYQEGIETDVTSVRNWHGLFQAYLNWGISIQDPSLARRGLEAITRVCKLRPHSPIHLNEWGVCLLQLRQLEPDLDVQQALVEEAILRFKEAHVLIEDLETLYNWGCALDQLGDLSGDEEDYEKSIELLSEVYDANPQEPQVCYHLGLALSHFAELTGSIESFYQSIELLEPLAEADPDDGALWCDLGYIYLNLSELLDEPIQPERGDAMRREAEKRLLHAVEEGNEEANYHLACLYSLAGLVDASIHFLKRAEAADTLPPEEDLAHDEWLSNVRKTDLFKEFMMW